MLPSLPISVRVPRIAETKGNNATEETYTSTVEEYGDLISEYDGTDSSYHTYDALGSTDALLDPAQTSTASTVLRAFGEVISKDPANDSNFTFVGQTGYHWDPAIDLYFVRARWYDPLTGKWLSDDPDETDINPSRYVGNNPVNVEDPSGNSPKSTVVAWVVRRTGFGVVKTIPLYTKKEAARLFALGFDILVVGGLKQAKQVARIVIKKGNLRKSAGVPGDRAGHIIPGSGGVTGLRHVQDATRRGQHIFYSGVTGTSRAAVHRFSIAVGGLMVAGTAASAVAGEYQVATHEVYSNPRPGPSMANALSVSWWKRQAGHDSDSWLDWVNPFELLAIGGETARNIDREREKEFLGVTTTIMKNDQRWMTFAHGAEGELKSVTFWDIHPVGITVGGKGFEAALRGENLLKVAFGDMFPPPHPYIFNQAEYWDIAYERLKNPAAMLNELEELSRKLGGEETESISSAPRSTGGTSYDPPPAIQPAPRSAPLYGTGSGADPRPRSDTRPYRNVPQQ